MNSKIYAVLIIISLLLVGCGGNMPAQPTTTPMPTPTRTPRPVGADFTGNEVESTFQGETYKAKVIQGGIALDPSGLPAFDGIISGTSVVRNEPYKSWDSLDFTTLTKVRILRYDPSESTFLVDGTVEHFMGNVMFLAPGAIIENATLDKQSVPLAQLKGSGFYDLAFGKSVQIDISGDIKPLDYPAISVDGTSTAAPARSGSPTYSEVLDTYPNGTELCKTEASLDGIGDGGNWLLKGDVEFKNSQMQVKCYGTKITINVSVTMYCFRRKWNFTSQEIV